MDLSVYDTAKTADGGAVLEVRHPGTGAKLKGVRITLLGADSPRWRAAQAEKVNRRLSEASAGRRAANIEDADEDAIELLAAATIKWEGVELDGKALECSTENACVLYRRLPWLREQADRFIADRANFLPALSKT